MALVNLEIYCSIPNVHAGNNSFRYSPDEGATWFPIALSSYGIDGINYKVHRQLRLNKHSTNIIIEANHSTLRATVILARRYQVDFDVENSLNTVFGFERRLFTFDMATNCYTEEENIGYNISTNSILVQTITNLLQNGTGSINLELSATQMQENMQNVGGFLFVLATRALPMIANTILPALGVGTLSGLGGEAVNKALESGLYLQRCGCVSTVHPSGKGLPQTLKRPDHYKVHRQLRLNKHSTKIIIDANGIFTSCAVFSL
ncbi:unnamed protein product [Mytilus edulis]|uniref:Uncharacterized protein n=1 Tax=Mytilus edulis TaxID=6550 RepID=A0A8S3UIU3_MYTED|nr:unnamed protein product [Mytilus edulis]